jgi:hypothetical protein
VEYGLNLVLPVRHGFYSHAMNQNYQHVRVKCLPGSRLASGPRKMKQCQRLGINVPTRDMCSSEESCAHGIGVAIHKH